MYVHTVLLLHLNKLTMVPHRAVVLNVITMIPELCTSYVIIGFFAFTCSGIEIRSPLIKVSTLLSSITEFIDSIHSVSTGPSNTSHFWSGFSSAQVCLITLDRTPSVHSLVFRSNSPYSSPRDRALGLMGQSYVLVLGEQVEYLVALELNHTKKGDTGALGILLA